MIPRGTWDSCEGGVWRCTAAMGGARTAGKDIRTPLHDCRSPTAARHSLGRLRSPPSPGLTSIILALLCSLAQLAAASPQLPASSPHTARLAPRLQDDSQAFTQHTFLRITAAPLWHESPKGRGVSAAEEGRQDPETVTVTPPRRAAVTVTPIAEAPPPRRAEKDVRHAAVRAKRSITNTTIRRIEMHGPPVTTRKTVFVEVMVLADSSLYRYQDRQEGAVLQNISQILSVANMVLGGIGVVLVPVQVQVWKGRDKFQVTSTMETNIQHLQDLRLKLLQQWPSDHTVLLTRKQMRGRGSCGTPLRGMCKKKESVSVVQDEGEGPGVMGVALAHQVGHSLGMEDDSEDPAHACYCAASTCVMSRDFRKASTPRLAWSGCSRQSFDSAMETLALDCLRNVPTWTYRRSTCGDGVVDDGEQCDCGPAEFCDNPCCVATTCRLATHASCASGSCCDIEKCQPKPPGTLCRAVVTECDLPEFCSGHSEYCPKDVTKADGAACRDGYCFSGECGSREGQCKRMSGSSASAASPDCYDKINVRGHNNGNCGMSQGSLSRCQKQDSLCGTLHCLDPVLPSHVLPDHRAGSARVRSHECHFISSSKEYPAHHWLTPNGASCGAGKMCIKQKCREVPRLAGDCRDGCSGNGVCNSRNHCHCDTGFAPPTCFLPGLGGSVDSNVMSDVSDPWLFITLAWVALVLLLSLLAVTCCSWGFFKGWYKRKGRDNIFQILPCCTGCLDACCCPVMTMTARWMLTIGSSPEKKKLNTNVEVDEEVNEHILCSVDVDVKGTSQSNTWGVASEKLVTDLVTITPKNSPDFRRKVKLTGGSPLLHHRSEDNMQRPKYLQSISMDSGCESDTDEDTADKRSSLQLSMSSLLNTLMKFGEKKPKTTPENEIRLSKNFGSQKSIPLSRFVVDPLAGRLGARKATPPSQHVRTAYSRSFSTDVISSGRDQEEETPPPHPQHDRPAYNRSFSTDIVSSGGNQRGGTPPPPPPPGLKPNKSEEILSKGSEMSSRTRSPYRKHSPPAGSPTPPKKFIQKDDNKEATPPTPCKVPLMPHKNKPLPSTPKVSPTKTSPPQKGNQRHHGGKVHGQPFPTSGTSRPSPPKVSSGAAQSSSPGTAASNTVKEMTRKFEVA